MFEKFSEPFGINDAIMMEISDAVGAHHHKKPQHAENNVNFANSELWYFISTEREVLGLRIYRVYVPI
jgi:hypothetical protein